MVGIGYRKEFSHSFIEMNQPRVDFVEVAPENWMGLGGYWKKQFLKVLEKYPLYLHGLSLSIGSPDELDMDFLGRIKAFIQQTGAKLYSEHLSYSKCDNAHLYDLLPIPFTRDAVNHVSRRIVQVQEYLQQKIAIEIVSYYTPVLPEMSEIDFICDIQRQSGCDLLLDVNNVYVNAFNHRYSAKEFINGLPLDKVAYIHMAGHDKVAEDLIIDTHGAPIIEDVYSLFAHTMQKLARDVPVLLERDFNMPEMAELEQEVQRLRQIKSQQLALSPAITTQEVRA